jgi:predicted enzyme related to lactoylglutathione lyase
LLGEECYGNWDSHPSQYNDDAEKVVCVAVLVSDQDKALDFYTNVIGLEKRGDSPTRDGPRWLTVGVKGQDFELAVARHTGRAKPGSVVYTIEVENIQVVFETLKSRGLKFEAPEILEFPWGYAGRFQDPDGNQLQAGGSRGISALNERARGRRNRLTDGLARHRSRPGDLSTIPMAATRTKAGKVRRFRRRRLDKPAPSGTFFEPSCVVISCGSKLSEVRIAEGDWCQAGAKTP